MRNTLHPLCKFCLFPMQALCKVRVGDVCDRYEEEVGVTNGRFLRYRIVYDTRADLWYPQVQEVHLHAEYKEGWTGIYRYYTFSKRAQAERELRQKIKEEIQEAKAKLERQEERLVLLQRLLITATFGNSGQADQAIKELRSTKKRKASRRSCS